MIFGVNHLFSNLVINSSLEEKSQLTEVYIVALLVIK